jgi:hypothetical protein
VVLRDDGGDIIAIYDVKTGNAEIDPSRAARFRAALGVGPNVPVIELHLQHGVSSKCSRLIYEPAQGWMENYVNGNFCLV